MAWSTYRNSRFPIPPLPAWVSGRFYGFSHAAGALGSSNQRRWVTAPVLVPNYVTIVGIGCEVATGAASSYMRLALYSNLADALYPGERLVQTAALDISAAAYVSEVISLNLRPDWYWLSGCWNVGGTLRFVSSSNLLHVFPGPNIGGISQSSNYAVIDVGNSNATINADVVNNGFPASFPRLGLSNFAIIAQANDMINILLEVD